MYRALKGENPVLSVFIFDREILDKLEDKDDARVTFIYQTIDDINTELKKHGSGLFILYDKAEDAWDKLLKEHTIAAVYTNHDYEPYAKKRDEAIAQKLKKQGIEFKTYKDQVIFDSDEVVKGDGSPYTVYTPYMRKWYETLKPFYLEAYPTKKYLENLLKTDSFKIPTLKEMGFEKSSFEIPGKSYEHFIKEYAEKRDFPGTKGTSHIGLHLRFGTVSIRELASTANIH